MSKSKEELNKIKEEVEAMNEKLQELTEKELEQVSGGLDPDVVRKPGIEGPALQGLTWLSAD